MLLLEATNYCLRKAGRDAASDASKLNPAAANAQGCIERVRKEILETGHSFNTRIVSLALGSNGRVEVDFDYLALYFQHERYAVQVDTEDDSKRYVWDHHTHDWHTEAMEEVTRIFDIEAYEDLPQKYATWIARQAAVEYWSEVNSGKTTPEGIRKEAIDARQRALNSEPPVDIRDRTGWRDRLRRFDRNPYDRRKPLMGT